MKYIAILSVLILLLTLVGAGSLYMTANIYVSGTDVTATEATTRQAEFDDVAEQVRLDAVLGTAFTNISDLNGAENYIFCEYVVELQNDCRIPAEMVELQISPMAGDVLQLNSPVTVSVPAGGSAQATVTLLTASGMHTVREITVTYYMWGIPFTLKTTAKPGNLSSHALATADSVG